MSQESRHEYIQTMMESHPFIRWLDISVETVEPGRVVVELPYRDEFGNPGNGALHGGIVATVMDQTAAMAVQADTYDAGGAVGGPTVDIRVSYVRPITGDMRAVGEVVRVGESIAMASAEATGIAPDGQEKTVATAEATFLQLQEPP